ncbi:MAG TPA: YbaK/EbsC family protein [Gammaproteobacteria bacterium]
MEMANTLIRFLAKNGIAYDRLPHRYSVNSVNTAHSAKIPETEMAKPVILEDDQGYIMAVIPASQHVKIRELNKLLNRNMGLATEAELQHLFKDCDVGAIPPVGHAYGMKTIVDYSLDDCKDVYFEAGNHEELIHVKGDAFRKLMKNTQHAAICMH